jgi:predicted MFS family arabinose efflux permease
MKDALDPFVEGLRQGIEIADVTDKGRDSVTLPMQSWNESGTQKSAGPGDQNLHGEILAEGDRVFNRREFIFLLLVTLANFCLFVDFMVLMPMGPKFMELFSISAAQFGFLVSSYTLSAGLVGMISAFFIDRLDRKVALAICLAGFAAGNLLCAFSATYPELMLARFVTGACAGVIGSTLFSMVSDAIPLEKRGTAIGVVMSSFAFASIFGVPFCLVLVERFNWQAPFAFLFGLSVLVIVLNHFLMPSMKGHLIENRQAWREFKEHWSSKSRLFSLIFTAFLILGHFSIIPFLFPSIVKNAGIPEKDLAAIYLVAGLTSILGSAVFGGLSDRFGRKKVFTLTLLASTVPIHFVTRLEPGSFAAVLSTVACFFLVMSARMAPAMALISTASPKLVRGSFLSLIGSVQHLATALAAVLSGMIVEKDAKGLLLNFPMVGWMAIGFSLASLLLILPIHPAEE